jgi:hypothetical protein
MKRRLEIDWKRENLGVFVQLFSVYEQLVLGDPKLLR